MSVIVILPLLKQAFPTATEQTCIKYMAPLNEAFKKYNIETVWDVCMFLAQIGTETGDLKRVVENLNYSAERLVIIFKKYFSDTATAQPFAYKPEKIANKVYASRLGNGDEKSGDGWKYRGRGLIQLTGKENYARFAKHVNMDLDDVIPFLETPEGACISAGYYWKSRNINGKTVEQATKLINGGTHGLEDRRLRHNRLLKTFAM